MDQHTPRGASELLLHRRELEKLLQATRETGHTRRAAVAVLQGRAAKVELAVAKGKKNYDKRHALRERQDRREADRAIAARRRGED